MLVNVYCAKEQSRVYNYQKPCYIRLGQSEFQLPIRFRTLLERFSYDPDNKDNAEPKPRS